MPKKKFRIVSLRYTALDRRGQCLPSEMSLQSETSLPSEASLPPETSLSGDVTAIGGVTAIGDVTVCPLRRQCPRRREWVPRPFTPRAPWFTLTLFSQKVNKMAGKIGTHKLIYPLHSIITCSTIAHKIRLASILETSTLRPCSSLTCVVKYETTTNPSSVNLAPFSFQYQTRHSKWHNSLSHFITRN